MTCSASIHDTIATRAAALRLCRRKRCPFLRNHVRRPDTVVREALPTVTDRTCSVYTLADSLRRALVALVLVAVAATVPAAPAAASSEPPNPRVIRPAPVPGDVVPTGEVELTAVLSTDAAVAEARLAVDGEQRPFRLRKLDGHNRRLVASVPVTSGHHIAEIEFRDADDRSARRMWRFVAADLPVRRLAGESRIETAVAVSQDSYPEQGSAGGAVLATATDYPDALAAAPLVAAVDGPLLLTSPEELSEASAAELERVLPDGATVHLLGGTSALSPEVADEVTQSGFEVVRLAGEDRAATAAAVASELEASDTAVVVAGDSFSDGLAASAPAARDGWPILLTEKQTLPASTRKTLGESDVTRVVIVGGTAVVSAEVEAELDELVDRVDRVAGADRWATATSVAEAFFETDLSGLAIATGEGFADALAGGPHAARRGIPVLLSRGGGLPPTAADLVAAARPDSAHLYGGRTALEDTVAADVRRAWVNGTEGPKPVELEPARGAAVPTLDTIEIGFDRGLEIAHTSVHVTVDGVEVPGSVDQGDFTDRLVFKAAALPIEPVAGAVHDVEVHVLAYDGQQWRHVRWSFGFRKLELGRGDSGPAVRALQDRLLELGYWIDEADGTYGHLTSQAVMAFQKAEGLARTGSADRATRERLAAAQRPQPRASRSGRWVEIDKTRQIALFVRDGRAEWTMNTSTGTETSYTRPDGSRGFAHTPEGWFTFFRQIDGMREAELGRLWRPKYFTDAGHALHGSTSVPAHPASHGCVRLSYPAIDFVWEAGLAELHTRVFIYR